MPTKPRSFSRTKKQVPQGPNTPLSAYSKAKTEWQEKMGTPIVEANRWFITSAVLGLSLLVALIIISQMLPLKTVVPYLMEVDKLSGEVRQSAMSATSYKPQEREIRYFLSDWVRSLLEIGPTTPDALKKTYSKVRGPATDEFTEFLRKTNVFAMMKQDAMLRRTIEISSISFVQDRVALVRLVSTTRSSHGTAEEKRFIVNVNFELEPPKEEAEFLTNPIGFFVTHFDFREELK